MERDSTGPKKHANPSKANCQFSLNQYTFTLRSNQVQGAEVVGGFSQVSTSRTSVSSPKKRARRCRTRKE